MSDGEVDPQKKPVRPPPETDTSDDPPDPAPEYVPTIRTARNYLWLGETDQDIEVGPINTRVQVGDTILVHANKFQEQWACVVDSVGEHQMAKVHRL